MKRIFAVGAVAVMALMLCSACKKTRVVSSGTDEAASPAAPVGAEPAAPTQPQPASKQQPPTEPAKVGHKNMPPDPKAPQPQPEPKVKPEDQSELLSGKGITKMRFPGSKEAMDVLLAGDAMDVAGKLGIEIGEREDRPGARKAAPKPKAGSFSVGDHKLSYDDKGKFTRISIALKQVPGGLKVDNVIVPALSSLENLKSLIDSCGAIERLASGGNQVKCHGGKTVVTETSREEGIRVIIGS